MEPSLITTKLYIPPAPPELVSRPRLLEKMKAAANYKLALVSAPAGFGKTTLLAEWVHKSQRPGPTAVWLSLEENENDPRRFWEYFIAALRTVHPDAGETSLALLRSSRPSPVEWVLVPLVNELAELSQDLFLVLDDYHFIDSEQVHKGITFLLEHLPPRLHLVIATRADPPLPLNRFRGKGTLLEIGADDLRFTLEEAVALLASLSAPALSSDDIETLNTRAEGWVVGLKMAVLSLHGEKDALSFISSFTGSQRYIMDYLIEEVLQRQPAGVRDFLLKTSVLERLSGPLCDAVTGGDNSREVLLGLEKNKLFIVPLDASREWYRYEHLFADLLRHRLQSEYGKETVRELQARASRWYGGNGYQANAIDHALAAGDWDRALDLLAAAKPFNTYGGLTAFNWYRRLPVDILLSRPESCIQYAWSLVSLARYNDARDFLVSFLKSPAYDAKFAGKIAAIQANIAMWNRDPRVEEYAREALSLTLPDDAITQATISLVLGMYYMHSWRYNDAEPPLKQAYELYRKAGDKGNAGTALGMLAAITMLRGKLHQAAEEYRQAIALLERHPNAAIPHEYLAVVYYQWNDLDAAEIEIAKALALNPGNPEIIEAVFRYTVLIKLARGDTEGAAVAVDNAERQQNLEDAIPVQRARIAGHRLGVAAAQGDQKSITRWLDEFARFDMVLEDIPHAAMRLVHRKQWGKELEAKLAKLYEQFRAPALKFYQIPVRVEQSLAASNPDEALGLLADALAMASPEGFVRSIVEFGPDLAPLLRRAVAANIEPEYTRRLLSILEEDQRRRLASRGEIPQIPVVGLLSEREMEVLHLMAAGLSNSDVAARLIITLNTAKTHVYHIYNKLGATSRVQAIARARELKLL